MDVISETFKQGLLPGMVIAIVYIVEKIISSKKKDPLSDIAKLLNIVTKDIIEKDKEKSRNVVDIILSYGGLEFIRFVSSTIVNNNIDDNREQIEYNAQQLIESIFRDVYSKLCLYKGNANCLSAYMKDEWKNEIYDDMINIIYNVHLDKYKRILAFNDRIKIRITNYAAYIINSAFR